MTVYSAPQTRGAVAQLGERLNGIQEVEGSIPFGSTIFVLPATQSTAKDPENGTSLGPPAHARAVSLGTAQPAIRVPHRGDRG